MAGKAFNMTKGVLSFNERTGNVAPKIGDYTPNMVGARPNRNLVINPNFRINQLNFSSAEWKSGYGPDGWRSSGSGNLEYTGGPVKTNNQYLLQLYELGKIDSGFYTISAFCTDNISGDFGFFGGHAKQYSSTNYENGFASATVEITDDMISTDKNGYLYISCLNSGEISFVKVEKSKFQTLAYKDSSGKWTSFENLDLVSEFKKCQRYLLIYNDFFVGGQTSNYGDGYKLISSFPIPEMRVIPSVSCTITSKIGTATDNIKFVPKKDSLFLNIESSNQSESTTAAAYINMVLDARL